MSLSIPRRRELGTAGLALLGACALLACGESEPAGTEPPGATPPAAESPGSAEPAETGGVDAAARAQAKAIFDSRCVTCHGPMGEGDGPGSAGLDPSPRNFQDPAWQESVSDDHIENIIQYGGAAVGKSPTMPANPDLTAKPAVVAALREHIRSLGDRR